MSAKLIIEEINALKTNKEKVQKFMDLGLHPKYGLSAEITYLMFNLYEQSSGDYQYGGKFHCSACQDVIFRKLGDFLRYNDNMGAPLKHWEEPKEIAAAKTIMEQLLEGIDEPVIEQALPQKKTKPKSKSKGK